MTVVGVDRVSRARGVGAALALGAWMTSRDARAQDGSFATGALADGALAQDAAGSGDLGQDGGSAGGAADAGAVAARGEGEGACEEDAVPAGHAVRIETRVLPARPKVGDRVLVTYRLFARSSDRVEFEPDPAAFAQPDRELEYARSQPDRDRTAHAGPGGTVYGEVTVAVQPFTTGEVVIPRQLARLNASGDVVRVCTPAVRFRVTDPFGNTPHPSPRDLTDPEVVTADSLRWRYGLLALDAGFVLVLATAATTAYLRGRPKVEPPPPPPVPPWIVAFEALEVLSRSDLLSRGLTKEYYDQLSDIVRRYIGALRGFDALEMTTDEILAQIRRVPIAGVTSTEVAHLLRECDLVKFARYVPSHEEIEQILEAAMVIVKRSSPGGQRAKREQDKGEQETSEHDKREQDKGEQGARSVDGETRVVEHEEKRG
jgi:hypothetical protein